MTEGARSRLIRVVTSDTVDFTTYYHTHIAKFGPHNTAPLNIGVNIPTPPQWCARCSVRWRVPRGCLRGAIRLERITIICLRPLSGIHIVSK